MKTPKDVLRDAAGIIERDGWTQGKYYVEPPAGTSYEADIAAARTAPVCSMGAIYRAVYGSAWMGIDFVGEDVRLDERLSDLAIQASDLLRAQVDGVPVPAWNDADERSVEDVLLAMKLAAAEE